MKDFGLRNDTRLLFRNDPVAVRTLKENPQDSDARGVILYGASISTSGRLGLGKEENFAYDIYELEFILEVLYGAAYRKSLTTLFPRFLKAMVKYHDSDLRRYFKDAFGYEGSVEESADKMVGLSADEVTDIVKECIR